MKPVLDILASISKLAFGEKQTLAAPAPAPVANASVVYGRDNVTEILLCVIVILAMIALLRSLKAA